MKPSSLKPFLKAFIVRLQAYKQRTKPTWGLMEWVADTCTRFKVDKLLIEAKASGIPHQPRNRSRTHHFRISRLRHCPIETPAARVCPPAAPAPRRVRTFL